MSGRDGLATGRRPCGGRKYQSIRCDHGNGTNEEAVDDPQSRPKHLDTPQNRRSGEKVGRNENRRRNPTQNLCARGADHDQAPSGSGANTGKVPVSRIITRSVRLLSHPSSVNPFDSNKSRISDVRIRST
jgi:hypothetical protein